MSDVDLKLGHTWWGNYGFCLRPTSLRSEAGEDIFIWRRRRVVWYRVTRRRLWGKISVAVTVGKEAGGGTLLL